MRFHRIGAANIHNNPAALRFMLDQGCHTLALSEAEKLQRMYRGLTRYRAFNTPTSGQERRTHAENPVLWKRRIDGKRTRVLGVTGRWASNATTPARIAPDRYITSVSIEGPIGAVATVSIHPNFVGKGQLPAPRIREYHSWSQSLAALLTYLEAENDHVIVAGDANTFPFRETPGWDDAYDILEMRGYEYRRSGLDVIAFSPGLRPAGGLNVIPRERLKSDHEGLILDLTKA